MASAPSFPEKYFLIPSDEPSCRFPFIIMIRTKSTGIGTVAHTMYEELLTPLKTHKKMMNQTARVEPNAVQENVVGSPSSNSLH